MEMMDKAMDKFDGARDRMAGDFRAMINDSEDLLKAAAVVSNESFRAARTKFEERVKSAKASLAETSQPLLEQTRETVVAANKYVRANPWTAVGIAVAVGVLFGFIAAKR
jgi:ElaB/YqjD/DUF883 family membrane-anchored ribosome-binding protein